jgi:hypothetical protein
MGPSRRRITVNDSHSIQRPQPEQHLRVGGVDNTDIPARPVSWHPSTYVGGAPQYYMNNPQQSSCYPFSTPNMFADGRDAHPAHPQLSPMMAAYSTNTSPCSSFSPLPFGVQASAAPQYLNQDGWDFASTQRSTPYFPQADSSHLYPDAPPSLTYAPNLDTPADKPMDWNPYMMHNMVSTSPPTPDSFVPLQQTSQPAVSDAAVSCEQLEDTEEEGEILVGMGLYDAPDKHDEDPQLNNYRSTVSSLLGSAYRPMEPTGKGLTLEEAWEPPQSDDDDDEEDEEQAEATVTAT